jgi:hypothetical protein
MIKIFIRRIGTKEEEGILLLFSLPSTFSVRSPRYEKK